MKTLQRAICAAAVLLALAMGTEGAIVTVNISSSDQVVHDSDGIAALTRGTAATGDGAVLQLGYFSAATSAAPFAGTWVALTGEAGANSSFAATSIGDSAVGLLDGQFQMSLVFNPAAPGADASLPAAGIPLSIRIYNGTSIAGSTHYITIASPAATWPSVDQTVTISLNQSDLWLENGTPEGSAAGPPGAGTFSTTLPVPEPSVLALQALAAFSILGRRVRAGRR